jgi:hypothetical protein
MAYAGIATGKTMNPSRPTMGNILSQSPILGKASTAKGSLHKVTKPNLKNMGKSIKPTVRTNPYGRE